MLRAVLILAWGVVFGSRVVKVIRSALLHMYSIDHNSMHTSTRLYRVHFILQPAGSIGGRKWVREGEREYRRDGGTE